MIDLATGLEAYIKPSASEKQYKEHTIDRGLENIHIEDVRYIAAHTNERFSIVIKFPPNFDFKGADLAKIECRLYSPGAVDHSTLGPWVCCSKFCDKGATSSGATFEIETFNAYNVEKSAYHSYGFSLAEAKLSDARTSGEQETTDRAFRGMIYISITPGFYVDKGLDEAQMRARKKPTAVLTTRKTAFEYGRSHVLDPKPLGKPYRCAYDELFGGLDSAYKPIEFAFFYVDPEYLEQGFDRRRIAGVKARHAEVQTVLTSTSSKDQARSINPKALKSKESKTTAPKTTAPKNATLKTAPLRIQVKSKAKTLQDANSNEKRTFAETNADRTDECDDEEPLPKQRIKVQPPVDDDDERTPNMAPFVAATQATTAASVDDMMTEQAQPAKEAADKGPTASEETANQLSKFEKARKKSRLLLRLEEIKTEKRLEEIKVRQQLMELDDDVGQ